MIHLVAEWLFVIQGFGCLNLWEFQNSTILGSSEGQLFSVSFSPCVYTCYETAGRLLTSLSGFLLEKNMLIIVPLHHTVSMCPTWT